MPAYHVTLDTYWKQRLEQHLTEFYTYGARDILEARNEFVDHLLMFVDDLEAAADGVVVEEEAD